MDKQIIIKRIRDCDNCKFRPETSKICSDYENCYMVSEYICDLRKQLKRKEQECEIFKKKLDIALRNNINITHLKLDKVDLQSELDQLKAENEQYKKVISKLAGKTIAITSYDTPTEFCDHKDLTIQLLKKENEKLKKAFEDIAEARIEICNQCGERDDYNIPCKQIRDLDYELQIEIQENEKLKQTLTEIKEIAKNGCYDDCNMPLDELVIILEKISEVIDED